MVNHILTSYEISLKSKDDFFDDENIRLDTILSEYFDKKEKTSSLVQKYLHFEPLSKKEKTIYEGYVKAGEYGITGELRNTETGDLIAKQGLKDAMTYLYYYRIYCYDRMHAILILQKIGANGIKTAFSQDFEEFMLRTHSNYSLDIIAKLQTSTVEEFFKKAKISSVAMDVYKFPAELENQLDKNQRPKRFKATISIPLWTWDRKLVEFFQKNKGTTKLYGTECNNIRFKCKLNGRTFTFKAANILETGIDLEVEQKYLNKTTGLPNEKDIASLAEELTTDLLRQENVIQD